MTDKYAAKALRAIKDFGEFTADSFEAFLKAGYGASIRKVEYEFNKIQKERRKKNAQETHRRKYSDLLYRLKRDGLIEKLDENNKSFVLTIKGKRKLENLEEKNCQKLPNSNDYEREQGDKFIIVIFDIPEKEKRKRNWLRAVLKRLNLKMIQKSVWIGKIKLPRIFIDDLLVLEMVDYVEIFEISKTGGLRHVI